MSPQSPSSDDRRIGLAVRAARLYYLQELDMATIGRELGMSRSSVSRLLAFARSTGLVDITIHPPADRTGELAGELRRRFTVEAEVVPTTSQTTDIDRLERVGQAAGRLLSHVVDSDMTLGIAWGTTVSAMSRHLEPRELWNLSIVQLNGAGNSTTSGIDYASAILERFADAYSARVEHFPVPAFFDEADTKVALWRERSTRRVLDVQRRMDVALFGLGTPDADVPGHVYAGGYLAPDDFAALRRDGVAGDVATRFYRHDGSDAGIALNERSSGPDLDTIRSVQRRICVVAGESKAAATEGAFAAGLITDLVADESLARLLIHRDDLRRGAPDTQSRARRRG
ncbi:sugar-binding transcriptional regulator [Gordonia jinhuaensis]|uniref:Transcriptional regulator n=1 Tax=Gordonia jinhuaensis TaxID=1517702 RepID=A0A916WST4_9ACTN|nr:sugar-binding domain-containing protein [Gordonia jinhuaensis]GGB27279.1 transcriptional regulator [Gordonia jinhuaensis]